ncbi:DUF4145 domain-containing protein [Sulfurimonas diazotrophicus]|uniref:DUF4145 domain-containing protein n=1 Tax=Sulfurimonas diazotrophicus TaxID=3131939 RepID=A0ABZ3H780_9BACT
MKLQTLWEKIRRRKSGQQSFWINEEMIVLDNTTVPHPHADMPRSCIKLYNEARTIVRHSPKSSAAILRLVFYALMKELGETGVHIDRDIHALVKRGMPKRIQTTLEYCRVTGKNGVPPGEVDLHVTPDMPLIMFTLINFIVEEQITRAKRIEKAYDNLPVWEPDET